MRTVKGFGKNYFRLQAVQAYSTSINLESISSSMQHHQHRDIEVSSELEELEEESPIHLEANSTKECDQQCLSIETNSSLFYKTPPQNYLHKGTTL